MTLLEGIWFPRGLCVLKDHLLGRHVLATQAAEPQFILLLWRLIMIRESSFLRGCVFAREQVCPARISSDRRHEISTP